MSNEQEMADVSDRKLSVADLAQEINRAFPDLKCLRCGGEKFFLSRQSVMGPISQTEDGVARIAGGHLETVALSCPRCGFVEQHLVKILLEAPKPIPVVNSDGRDRPL
ncbi:hypothetical protein ACNHKD_00215 [Methylocystis sp. JAN1]|jgi:hypothetical protein|uniref:hypothetical protein n=1 Tax=Methylocystis sp. JAN1 TaxID=3397211 RepID=UPI003FA2FF4B